MSQSSLSKVFSLNCTFNKNIKQMEHNSHPTTIIPFPLLSLNGYGHPSSSDVQLICINQCALCEAIVVKVAH